MKKLSLSLLAVVIAASGCAPQSRVEELETRVEELEALVLEIRQPDVSTFKLNALQVSVPHKDCVQPGLAIWEKNGKLGCLSPKIGHIIEGYDVHFPPAKGCIGQFLIMGPESLTCDTPEHPYH